MSAALTIQINGQLRSLPELSSPSDLASVIDSLNLKTDRIAIEHNGEIVPRTGWSQRQVREADHIEIVHFVGGGNPEVVTILFLK